MSAKIMTFHITIDRSEISRFETETAKVTFIPFGGTVDSPYFRGKVMPGAADVQVTDASGLRHMCAKYMFEGTDGEGKHCHLFVENNGYFPKDGVKKDYFDATPKFITDSEFLNEILSRPVFRSEGHSTEAGVDIMIFDETREESEAVPEIQEPEDPVLTQLRDKEIVDEKVIAEGRRLYAEEKIAKLVFFSSYDNKTFTVDHPDAELITAVLNDLRGSAQMLFMLNEKGELAAVSYISGKIRNIENMVLTVYAEIFAETGQNRYFERPVNRYSRFRIREI
ncbi:MAG: DUF3237 family protein [Solobacterium sp.]|nr:DUF3237 family protein [Solobacterium sp.]